MEINISASKPNLHTPLVLRKSISCSFLIRFMHPSKQTVRIKDIYRWDFGIFRISETLALWGFSQTTVSSEQQGTKKKRKFTEQQLD